MPSFTQAALVLSLFAAAIAHAESMRGDASKGQALAAVCGACHGPDGNSAIPLNPNLAQQHPDYIAKQLANFKSGARPNAIMAGMVANLSPDDMKNLGAYFGSQALHPAPARDQDLVTIGQKLYRFGDAERGLPACAACHSPTGAGIPSQFPRLSGQHQDYTIAQLKAFRAGERANDTNNMMRAIAAKMTDHEMAALAEYAAGLR
ncbi:MAG: c-type cytochrome [Betaproteobacteria bacterium]